MEYSHWIESLQTENAISSYPQPCTAPSPYPPQPSLTTHYPSYPNPSSLPLNPPGVENQPQFNPIIYAADQETVPTFIYPHTHVGLDPNSSVPSSGYCFDPNWAATQPVSQLGTDSTIHAPGISMISNGSEQLPMANASTVWWTNTSTQPHGNGIQKKNLKKTKTKLVQAAYCEVCKIECTGKEVLDQHKLGKKHKRNLEKLRESLTPTQVQQSVSSNPVIGPQLPDDKSKYISGNKKRKKVETAEDLAKKKKKVLEGGAAADAVKICAICNVVCNSDTVFSYHLAGQKHAAVLKKASERSNAS